MRRASRHRHSVAALAGLGAVVSTFALPLSGAQAVTSSDMTDSTKSLSLVDDSQAEKIGEWKVSTHVRPFIGEGYVHDNGKDRGEKSIRFKARLPVAGRYQVFLAYTAGRTRASNVPVSIATADGPQSTTLNERVSPGDDAPFRLLGVYRFDAEAEASVLVSNAGVDGFVVADAALFLPEGVPLAMARLPGVGDKPAVASTASSAPANATAGNGPKSAITELRAQQKISVPADGRPAVTPRLVTPGELDAIVAREAGVEPQAFIDDEAFLRRADFDLIGRQPTPDELAAFLADSTPDKRARHIDARLASPEFGANWANYWVDTIAYRVPPPELTYLNYEPLRGWLTQRLNANAPWDEIVRALLTAKGKIADEPAATFIGYHQANPVTLASETSRIFLGAQVRCAQCHDHPFDTWTRDQFHEMAAFYARSGAKLSQNDGAGTVVSSKEKGEYVMPDASDPSKPGKEMNPVFLDGAEIASGLTDAQRRDQLAQFITAADNPWFAKAYVNRIWARLFGRGFYEPVDNLGDGQSQLWPDAHEALAAHFLAAHYDVKDLMRLIMATRTYGRAMAPAAALASSSSASAGAADSAGPAIATSATPLRLRGDEVFSALATGIGLPNITPPAMKPTAEVRFPPPPKSTRDLVAETFGFDPSLSPADAPRTMSQAMLMMNNDQLQAQVDARPDSGTFLARLLVDNADDGPVIEKLFRSVLARAPNENEFKLAHEHIAKVGGRIAAFEDLLWGMLNSAEFTSKR